MPQLLSARVWKADHNELSLCDFFSLASLKGKHPEVLLTTDSGLSSIKGARSVHTPCMWKRDRGSLNSCYQPGTLIWLQVDGTTSALVVLWGKAQFNV